MNGLLLWIVVDVATCIAPSLSFESARAAWSGQYCTLVQMEQILRFNQTALAEEIAIPAHDTA